MEQEWLAAFSSTRPKQVADMDSQRFGGWAWPVVCVAVAGILGYWVMQGELVSSRPALSKLEVPDPVPPPGVYSFHSRMWEDPLSKSYLDWKQRPLNERALIPPPIKDSRSLEAKAAILAAGGQPATGAPWIQWFVASSLDDDLMRVKESVFQAQSGVSEAPRLASCCDAAGPRSSFAAALPREMSISQVGRPNRDCRRRAERARRSCWWRRIPTR